jgi:protein-L-isoaspartate(D-aspartate) O-methyltransferase
MERTSRIRAGAAGVAVLLATSLVGVVGGSQNGREAERMRMVREQIEARSVKDPRVLQAMREVPRHRFVPEAHQGGAYGDHPLPIGHDQTISQPYIVAFMTEALGLQGGERVLEIGTGSGYQAAVLSNLVKEVFSIEILKPLADEAEKRLVDLGYRNVEVRCGDGYQGWPDKAPFDAIIVTAAPPEIPQELVKQLRVGGKMVVPVGTGVQELMRVTRTGEGTKTESLLPVRFVPMVPGSKSGR